MALVKCPDCEKMVSPRVDRCPFCGCPAEFFQKMQDTVGKEKSEETNTQTVGTEGTQNGSNEKMPEKYVSFDLCGVDVEFSVYIEKFAQLFGTYLKAGDEAYAEMLRLYKEAGSISKALETLPESAEDFIFGVIDEGTKFLYKQGVNITQEKFFQKYNRKYPMSYSVYFERIVEKYSDISGAKAELAAYREAQKAARGRWSGGGFGLKGAVKGAVTASALNMGADFLHSFGDSAQRKEDNKKFSAEYRKLYRNSRETLCYSVKTCIMNVFYAMVEELEKIQFFEETYALNKKEADTRYEAVIKYGQDKDEIFDKMIDCILDYPGERRFYEKIKDRIINEKSDIGAFLKFWNIEYLIADILKTKDEQDNFDHFMEDRGILKFDFTDMSAKNVGSLLQRIAAYRKEAGKEYLKEIPSESRYADRIKNYFREAVHSLEQWDHSILSWIPADATFREFWDIAAGEGERLKLYSVGGFSRHITSESRKKLLEKIKDGGTVLLCCDTSLLENYSKGLVVTEKYSMDLKTGNKVENNKISVIDLVKIKNSHKIRLSDGIREIVMLGGEDGGEWDFPYFKLVMELVFVRYCGNLQLYKPSMGNVHAETDIKTSEYIKGYYSDLNVSIIADERNETQPTAAEKADADPYIFCTSCGKRIQRTAKFCNFCGAKNSYGNAKKKPSEYDAYLAADNYLLKASKVYTIPNRGPVVNGTVVFGTVRLGGSIMILNPDGSWKTASIIGMKSGGSLINKASEGTEVDIMLKGVEMTDIQKDALIKEGGHGDEMP